MVGKHLSGGVFFDVKRNFFVLSNKIENHNVLYYNVLQKGLVIIWL